ncbi:MAG: cell division protein FtsQ/DivIB [Methylophilaceae bacterium]
MWGKPTLLNWIANFLLALSIVAMLYAVLYAVIHLPIFPLREVKIDGQLNHVNHEQVKLIVAKHLKGNFFTLDLIKARDAFEKLPWARKVSLRRRWPDTLEVNVEEHQALARWGTVALVDTHGEVFQAASDAALPTFYGPGDGVIEVAAQYGEFSKALQKANLKIASITLTPRHAWQITTEGGMLIELGRVEMQPRIEKFANVYVSTIAKLNKKITYADLRYPNGFAVRRPVTVNKLVDIDARQNKANSVKSKKTKTVEKLKTVVSKKT